MRLHSTMAISLRAFRIFAQQRSSTLKHISELLCPVAGDLPAEIPSSPSTSSMPSTLLLEIKYGLRLELEYGQAFKISDVSADGGRYENPLRQDDNITRTSRKCPVLESWPSGKMDTVIEASLLEVRNHYMILPNFQMSYF